MTKRLFCTTVLALAFSLLCIPLAQATAVIDFSTGGAGTGGTITLFSDGNLSGSGIPIADVTISGTAAKDGVYDVTGTATGSKLTGVGSLSFSTGGLAGTNFITITGAVVDLGVTAQDLLTGTITSFVVSLGENGLVGAKGIDDKADALLRSLGLSIDTPFDLFGSSFSTGTLTPQSPQSTAISTDVRNTETPEPSSLILLGSALLGLCGFARRRRK